MTTKKKLGIGAGALAASVLVAILGLRVNLAPEDVLAADPPVGPSLQVKQAGTIIVPDTHTANFTNCTVTRAGTQANISCAGGGGTVTSVDCGDGVICTPDPIVGAGTIEAAITNTLSFDGSGQMQVDQGYGFSWTAAHTWTGNSVGAATTPFITLQNTTAATSGNQKNAPSIFMQGEGFGTGGGATQTVTGNFQMRPQQASNALGSLVFSLKNGGGALTDMLYVGQVHPGFGALPGRTTVYAQGSTANYFVGKTIALFMDDAASPDYMQAGGGLIQIGTANAGRIDIVSTYERPVTDIAISSGDSTHRWNGVYSGNAVEISSSGTGQIGTSTTGQIIEGGSGLTSGVLCAFTERLTCSGTCTAGEVLVWSGTNGVAKAAAAADLTTIAGVATTTATNATVTVCRRGRVLVNADAGITAGELVATSGGTAGNVDDTASPTLGGIVGRATEATGGTSANKVIVDVILF